MMPEKQLANEVRMARVLYRKFMVYSFVLKFKRYEYLV